MRANPTCGSRTAQAAHPPPPRLTPLCRRTPSTPSSLALPPVASCRSDRACGRPSDRPCLAACCWCAGRREARQRPGLVVAARLPACLPARLPACPPSRHPAVPSIHAGVPAAANQPAAGRARCLPQAIIEGLGITLSKMTAPPPPSMPFPQPGMPGAQGRAPLVPHSRAPLTPLTAHAPQPGCECAPASASDRGHRPGPTSLTRSSTLLPAGGPPLGPPQPLGGPELGLPQPLGEPAAAGGGLGVGAASSSMGGSEASSSSSSGGGGGWFSWLSGGEQPKVRGQAICTQAAQGRCMARRWQ